MAPLIALLDASVLYPAELRSFLLYLAVTGLYQPRWSKEIHEEWITNLLANRPDLTRAKLERTWELMEKAAPGDMIKGYRSLIPKLTLPDPHDRHVLAAAIHSKARIIVTNNLKDFPAEVLAPFKIEARSPDDFIVGLFEISPDNIREAAEVHRLSLKNPAKTVREYLQILESQGLARTANLLTR
jgi:predicted nucleic acid-binding protein